MTVKYKRVAPNDISMMASMYRVRYQVYCLECGFRDPAEYPYKMEWDEYDESSLHYVAITDSGEVVGTVRLVLDSHLGFPLENHCGLVLEKCEGARNDAAEISRLDSSVSFLAITQYVI